MNLRWPPIILTAIFLLTVLSCSHLVFALSGSPAQFDCEDPVMRGAVEHTRCTIDKPEYVPPGSLIPHAVSFSHKPGEGKRTVLLNLPGWSAKPTHCASPSYRHIEGKLQVDVCASHYPDVDVYDGARGWGVQYFGSNHQWRTALALTQAQFEYRDLVDVGAGVHCYGTSYGAVRCLALSMNLEDKWYKPQLSVIWANIPALPIHELDRDPNVAKAWGDYDRLRVNFAHQAALGYLDERYYRVNGSTADNVGGVGFDPAFFLDCDRYKVACFGTWHSAGHNVEDPSMNLPYNDLYPGEHQQVRLDKMITVFTESTANHWGTNGHYNLGLSYHSGGYYIDRPDIVVIPLRYLAHRDIGGGVPDQPPSVTVSVTIRRLSHFQFVKGDRVDWELDGTAGTVTVTKNGEVTVEGLTLPDEDRFRGLVLRKHEPPTFSGLVWSSQPREMRPHKEWPDQSNAQLVTDIGLIWKAYSIGSSIVFQLEGEETPTTIHSCAPPLTCVAHEARVSPDATKIAYVVTEPAWTYVHGEFGAEMIGSTKSSKIWIYEIPTGEKYVWSEQPPALNRQPEWLRNDKLIFASSCGQRERGTCRPYYPLKDAFSLHRGTYPDGKRRWTGSNIPYGVSQAYGYKDAPSLQLWSAYLDGRELQNLTPHEQMALRPEVTQSGRVIYSCWNSQEDMSFYQNRPSSNPGTNVNKYWYCSMWEDGTDTTAILAAHEHLAYPKKWYLDNVTGGQGTTLILGPRACAEIAPNLLWCSHYYRSNHRGNGDVLELAIRDWRVEGCSTAACWPLAMGLSGKPGSNDDTRPGSGGYTPSTLRPVTPFGTPQDTQAGVMWDKKGRPMGKAGFPFALPDGRKGITRARGFCYRPLSIFDAVENNGGEPLCDTGIYEVLADTVTDPWDETQLKPLIDDPLVHEWDAQSIMVTPEPLERKPLNPSMECFLQIVDATQAETRPKRPWNWLRVESDTTAHQGKFVDPDDPEFHAANIAEFGLWGIDLWNTSNPDPEFQDSSNYHQQKAKYKMGSAPIYPDGSVKVEVPCNKTFQMSGLDREGRIVAHDPMLHSLRPGETRTCHGCHDGHSEERMEELGWVAAEERFRGTMADKAEEIPLLNGREQVTFLNDVAPILTEHCGECHEGFNNDDGLYWSRVAADWSQLDWPWIERKHTLAGGGGYMLMRPYFSPLVHRFCRNSLLCWYAWDERLDGRTNDDSPDDFNFKGPHESGVPPEKRRIIAEWINQGAPR